MSSSIERLLRRVLGIAQRPARVADGARRYRSPRRDSTAASTGAAHARHITFWHVNFGEVSVSDGGQAGRGQRKNVLESYATWMRQANAIPTQASPGGQQARATDSIG